MDSILLVVLSAFAVLGAYFLASLLAGGINRRPVRGSAVLLVRRPVTAQTAVELSDWLQQTWPGCELFCIPMDESQRLPSDSRQVTYLPADRLADLLAQRCGQNNLQSL